MFPYEINKLINNFDTSNIIGNSTFSSAVRDEIKLKVWNTNPSLDNLKLAKNLSSVELLIFYPHIKTSPFFYFFKYN